MNSFFLFLFYFFTQVLDCNSIRDMKSNKKIADFGYNISSFQRLFLYLPGCNQYKATLIPLQQRRKTVTR